MGRRKAVNHANTRAGIIGSTSAREIGGRSIQILDYRRCREPDFEIVPTHEETFNGGGGEFISNVFFEWNDKIEINFIENIVEVINTAKLDEKSKEYFFELFHLGYLWYNI